MGHSNKHNNKMGTWWQNLRSLHNLTQFCGIFDTNVVPGSMLQKDLEYSFISCQNLIGLCSVFVNLKPISYVLGVYMAYFFNLKKVISILAGNLKSGDGYFITTVI